MKKQIFKTLVCACGFMMAGSLTTPVNAEEDAIIKSVKVNKVNIDKNFALGMDVSSVIALEKGGVKYYDEDGNEKDIFKLCSENGTNYIRVRIWNNPKNADGNYYGGGNNDLNTALLIGKRAKAANMKVLIDLHYSDFWADPGKFVAPKDWTKLNPDEVTSKIYSWTSTVLNSFARQKIDVGMIQIGNEINNGLCNQRAWEPGSAGNLNKYYCDYLNSGLKAVTDFNKANKTSIQKVLHYTEPHKQCGTIYGKLERCGVEDYDIFATSYYPEHHGTLDNLYSILSQIGDTTKKKVMVAETNYPSYGSTDKSKFIYGASVQGQASYLRALISKVNSIDYDFDGVSDAVGVFYWEPAWPQISKWDKYGTGWSSKNASDYLDIDGAGYGYGQTPTEWISLFSHVEGNKQQALDSLKTFKYVRTGKKKLASIAAPTVTVKKNKITLKWKKISNAAKYKVYRRNKKNGLYKLVATVTSTSYTDKLPKAGRTYTYSVKAIGKNGIDSSDGSTPLDIYMPKNIKKIKSVKKNDIVTLKWVRDKQASGYIVYISNKKNGKYKVVKTIKSYKKSKYKISDGKTGYFKVRSYYEVGNKKIFGKLSKAKKVK